MAKRVYSNEFKQEVVNEVLCGMPLKRAARVYDLDRNTIRTWVGRQTGSIRQSSVRFHSSQEKDEVIRLVRNGDSRKVIAEHLGVSVASIGRWIQMSDVQSLKQENEMLRKRIVQLERKVSKYEAI